MDTSSPSCSKFTALIPCSLLFFLFVKAERTRPSKYCNLNMLHHLAPIKGHLPRLKSLTIVKVIICLHPFTSQPPMQPIHAFEEAPKLRLNRDDFELDGKYAVPLAQLTKCSLRGCTIKKCFGYFRALSSPQRMNF